MHCMYEFSWNYPSNQIINQGFRSIRCFPINIFWIHKRIDRQILERKRWVVRFRTELIKKLFYDRFPTLQKLVADTVSVIKHDIGNYNTRGPERGHCNFGFTSNASFHLIQTGHLCLKFKRPKFWERYLVEWIKMLGILPYARKLYKTVR